MRLRLPGLFMLCVALSAQAKTHTDGFYLYTTLDDNTCKVEQADATVKITDARIEIPAVVNIDGRAYSVTEIPDNAFKCPGSNYDVKEIVLPEGLTSIGEHAFENYTKVTELVLPNTLTTLSSYAFKSVTGLKKVTIGTGLRNIPDYVFERDGNITDVRVLSKEPPTLGNQAFPLPFFVTLTVPKGAKEAYAAAPVWSTFQTIVEDGTEIIEVPRPEISMDKDNMVTITCSDPRASIYYTFGTVSPTKESTLYTAPFELKEKTTVRAKAFIEDFQSAEAHAYLEPRVGLEIPDSLLVFLNGSPAWASQKRMAWHHYPIAADGESSREGDILGEACVWAEPAGDLLYMLSYDSYSESPENHLTTYDRGTLEFVSQEPLPNDFIANDLAVDPVTGNLYGVFVSKSNEYHFGYINLETKTRTNVAKYDLLYREGETTIDRVMALCFSPEGVAYGLTFAGRLVTFDRETGAYTVIGETKWNINYVSCARWDEKTGLILYAFSNQDGRHYFYTIDPKTAERNMLEEVPGSITAFFTPYDYVKPKAPSAPQNVTLSFPEGKRQGVLSFKAPATSQNGDEISGNLNYRIVRKGKTVTEGEVRCGGMASVDITAPMDGTVTYSVVLSNNYGESLRGKTSAFAGVDVPSTPSVTAEKTDKGIKLNWTAVTTGKNGGYIKADDIYYTVYRYPGKETVVSRTTDTSYTDEVAEPAEGQVKQYWYTVTAVCGDNMSEAAKSNKVVLGYFTPTWTESFSEETSLDNFTIINNSGYNFSDEETTSGWRWNNYWRSAGAFYHPFAQMDDWLITPPMMMEKGKTYRITFKAGAYWDRTKNYLEVCAGNDNTAAAMNKVLLPKFNVQSENQKGDWMDAYSVDYVPEETGLQYVGFHCLSEPNQLWLYLDDIKIFEGITAGAPKAVDNLQITPDAMGRLDAAITFNMPSKTVDEKAIEGIMTAEIIRDGEVVFKKESLAPGVEVSYTDKVTEHGSHEYQVRAIAGDILGMPILTAAFVGNSRPLAVTEIKAVENAEKYGEVTISWTAPEADELGRAIAPENLSYEIEYAWASGETDVLVSDIKDTSYTYTPRQATDKEEFIIYQVRAYTPYGKSNVYSRADEQIPVGTSHKAPWSQSFDETEPEVPLGISIINGSVFTCGWHVYNDSDGIDSQDGDNCFGGFEGVAQGNIGSLYTGKLDLADLTSPSLEFYVYKMGPEDVNTLEVQVGGFGNWESIDLISMDQLEEGWNKVTVPMDDFQGKTVQVKWIATVNLYRYVLVDNMKLDGGVNSIDGVGSERVPVASRFFTIDGIEVSAPAPDTPCIMVTTYSDGSVSRRKLMNK